MLNTNHVIPSQLQALQAARNKLQAEIDRILSAITSAKPGDQPKGIHLSLKHSVEALRSMDSHAADLIARTREEEKDSPIPSVSPIPSRPVAALSPATLKRSKT